jgi:hypothetical protein
MITIGTTLGAVRFITATTTIEAETRAAELTAIAVDLTATVAEIMLAAMKGTGPPTRTPAVAAGLKTVPAQRPGLLKETITLLEDTLNPVVKAGRARAPSATTAMADKKGASHHAEVPASAAVVAGAARVAAAGIDNRFFSDFWYIVKI